MCSSHECAHLILAQAAALVEVEAVQDVQELALSPVVVQRHLEKEVSVYSILGGGDFSVLFHVNEIEEGIRKYDMPVLRRRT
jgi:hypothetical protein